MFFVLSFLPTNFMSLTSEDIMRSLPPSRLPCVFPSLCPCDLCIITDGGVRESSKSSSLERGEGSRTVLPEKRERKRIDAYLSLLSLEFDGEEIPNSRTGK